MIAVWMFRIASSCFMRLSYPRPHVPNPFGPSPRVNSLVARSQVTGCGTRRPEARSKEASARSSSLPRLQPLQHRHERDAERPRQVRHIVEADGLVAALDLAKELT